jgi:integrase
MRHTFSKELKDLLVSGEISMEQAKEVLGHESHETTEGYMGRLESDAVDNIRKRVLKGKKKDQAEDLANMLKQNPELLAKIKEALKGHGL